MQSMSDERKKPQTQTKEKHARCSFHVWDIFMAFPQFGNFVIASTMFRSSGAVLFSHVEDLQNNCAENVAESLELKWLTAFQQNVISVWVCRNRNFVGQICLPGMCRKSLGHPCWTH